MENAISFDYFVYSRPAGERRFALTDLARGTVGLGKFYAPRYSKEQLDQLKKMARLRRRHLPRRSLPDSKAGWKKRRIYDALSKTLSASDKITSTAAQRQERKNIL